MYINIPITIYVQNYIVVFNHDHTDKNFLSTSPIHSCARGFYFECFQSVLHTADGTDTLGQIDKHVLRSRDAAFDLVLEISRVIR